MDYNMLEHQEEPGYWNIGRIFGVADGLFQTAALISGFTLFATADHDCDNPINLWTLLHSIYALCVLLMIIVFEFVIGAPSYKRNRAVKSTYYSLFGLLVLFNMVWLVLGSIWLFGDSNCSDCNF